MIKFLSRVEAVMDALFPYFTAASAIAAAPVVVGTLAFFWLGEYGLAVQGSLVMALHSAILYPCSRDVKLSPAQRVAVGLFAYVLLFAAFLVAFAATQ